MSVQNGISICKIMDYRKHLYDVKKKEKANQIKPKQMKDIKIKPNIGTHDLVIKANKVTELIEDGHKVKVSIIYRGREMSRIKEGKLLLETLLENTSVDVSVVMGPKIEGNAYIAILSK